MDIKHVLHCNPTDPVYASRAGHAPPTAHRVRLRRAFDGGNVEIGHDGAGVRVRQRSAASRRAPRAVSRIADRLVTARRVARVHRRRRLPPARALALRRLVRGAGARLGRAALLARRRRRRLERLHARRPAAARSERAGRAREPLRGRRVRALARRAAAHRVRVGARGRSRCRAPGTRCTRASTTSRVAVDRERVPPLPALRTRGRRGRRVQRQVHERPDGAARRRVRSRRPATRASPTATSSRPRAAGCSAACASRRRDGGRREHDRRRRRTRPRPRSPKDIPPKWFYDDRGSRAVRRDHPPRPSTTRPGASARSSRRTPREIARRTDADTLVELGSGTSEKTRVLLDAMRDAGTLARFVPFDVSKQTLRDAAAAIEQEYPGIDVQRRRRRLHARPRARSRAAAAGWSRSSAARSATCCPSPAPTFLARDRGDARPRRPLPARHRPREGRRPARGRVRRRARASPPSSTGTCSHVMNRELDADFDVDAFEHVAVFDTEREWIEMRLRSTRDADRARRARSSSTVRVRGGRGDAHRGERQVHARRRSIDELARGRACELVEWWTDPDGDFALSLARRARRDVSCRDRRRRGSDDDRQVLGHLAAPARPRRSPRPRAGRP